MVVNREKWLASHLRLEAERLVEAIGTLEPTTQKSKHAKEECLLALKEATKHLDTLYRHYCAVHRAKPPPKEGDHDLP